MRFKKLDGMIRALGRCRKGKWAKLIAGTPKTQPDCELCGKYPECASCPIGFITGKGCRGTPQEAWLRAAEIVCEKCKYQDEGSGCISHKEECPVDASRPKAKHHARREVRMMAAIQKGMEVMQRALAKIK